MASTARLVEIVLGLSMLTLIAEALGTFGWLTVAPLVVALAVAGLAVFGLNTRRRVAPDQWVDESDGASRRGAGWFPLIALGIGLLTLLTAWMAGTVAALDRGILTVDSIWQHLPIAARFAETGRTTSIHFLDGESFTAFVPVTSSLFHTIGIVVFGSDQMSTVMNMGWLAVALLAGWRIGRRYGVAPAAALGVTIVMATPMMVATQPGGAYSDTPGLALLLVATAICLRDSPPHAHTPSTSPPASHSDSPQG